MNIPAGELTERLRLLTRATTQDAMGQQQIAWTPVATVWAKRQPQRSAERFAAAQTQLDAVERFFVRARSDVTVTWRAEWKGRAYDITGVTLLGKDWLELICQEGVKDGR